MQGAYFCICKLKDNRQRNARKMRSTNYVDEDEVRYKNMAEECYGEYEGIKRDVI